MRKESLIAAIAAAMIGGTGASAAELPGFEVAGLPITPHQVAVTGAANVQEQSATATLLYGGMPASPHQIAVLTPRPAMTADASGTTPATVGRVSK